MPSPNRVRLHAGKSSHGVSLALGLSLGLVFLTGLARAHQNPDAPVPALGALKVDAPLTVDGVLDEPFWARAAVGSGFIDQRTRQPAVETTTVRVAYTRTHLYVAVECFDTHIEEIHATERREDRSFTGDDWVEIHFDPPHTHRSKYAFFANPLGTRADANEGPSGMFNYGWSADWDQAARIETNRWVFETRIPFTILNYERRDGQSWGFNVTRQLRRTDVLSFWSFSATDMYKPRHFGHLTGLDLGDSVFDRNWEITPYASVRTEFDGDTDTFFQAGVDVSARLTPSITGALTLNPDFGQIEADEDTIELRDTERFLPEKRLFFREGDELIRMPHRMYHSRRFTDIDAGLNVSGAAQGLTFSLLNVQGDVARDAGYYGNSTVLRVLQNLHERSSLGYYVSDAELEGSHARAASVDGYFFLTDTWRLSLQAAGTEELLEGDVWEGTPPVRVNRKLKDSLDYLGYGALIYERYPWSFNAAYTAISDEFNPLLGYIPRRNLYGPSVLGQIYQKAGTGFYKEYSLVYDLQYYEDEDGATTLRDHHLNGSVLLYTDVALRLGQAWEYHAPYDNRRTSAGLTLFAGDLWKSATLGWAGGRFTNALYNEFSLSKPIKFWERLPLQWKLTARFTDDGAGRERTVWLSQVVLDFYLAQDMWIKSSVQLQDHGGRNVSVIYGWQPWPRTWWYLVFNHVNFKPLDLEYHPALVEREGSSVFTKVTYTF